MKTLNSTKLRANLFKLMDELVLNHEELIISREDKESVVMLSLSDYEGLKETCYLLQSPKNAVRLMQSIKEVENNTLTKQDLIEE